MHRLVIVRLLAWQLSAWNVSMPDCHRKLDQMIPLNQCLESVDLLVHQRRGEHNLENGLQVGRVIAVVDAARSIENFLMIA